MKIMSFNTQHCLNYIERKIDFEIMARVIREFDPDIVGLNEMRGEGKDPEYTNQVATLARLTGMSYYYFAKAIDVGSKGPYGNGFLSKIPILESETLRIKDPETKVYSFHYETRCILRARLEGGITVLVTHFGLNPDEQECAVKAVTEGLSDKKCILMGDFNVKPDNSVLAPIRERLVDTASAFPFERLSFPSDAPDRKIDYIFVSPDIEVVSADILPVVASDHRPHVATVKI